MSNQRGKKLQYLFNQGKITRREFLTRASALGLTAALSPAVFSSPLMAASETPKKGGTLRMGIAHGSTSDSLDPAVLLNGFICSVAFSVCNHLVEIGPQSQLVPELAESWEPSQDLKTWRFNIRRGVEFHNGKTLDAHDVVASINYHRKKGSKSAAKSLLKPVVDIKAEGKHTVVFTIDQGYVDFPFILGAVHLVIFPASGDGIDWKSGNGTGPYVLDNLEPGVVARFSRNKNYWKQGRAHFDNLVMLSIKDVPARTNALKTGKVDIIDRPDLKTVHLLGKMPDIVIDETTAYAHYSIPMLTDTPPFDNNDLRMALKLALDRTSMLKILFRGHGVLGNDHPISPKHRFYAKELPQRVYDPEKAKYYLKKAGYDRITVPLHASSAAFAEAVDTAVLYQENARKAGIDIKVVREPSDGYWKEIWRKKPWCFCYWRGRVTEDWMFSVTYAAGAPYNDTRWKNERFNKLLVEARSERNDAKRREMYVEMQRIVRDEGGQVIPIFNNYVLARNAKLRHGPILPAADLDGYRLAERWWFA